MRRDYAYSAYGEATTLGPDGGNSLQYTGRENDGTGQQFNRGRYYDYQLKRWISEDPIGVAGGSNFYAYVNGDPVTYVDPDGRAANVVGGFAIGALGDIAIQLAFNGGRFECIKWDVVLIAGAAGAVNPFSILSAGNKAMKANKAFAKSQNLRPDSRVAKRALQKFDKWDKRSLGEGANWAAVEGGAEFVGNMIPDDSHLRIADSCECKN